MTGAKRHPRMGALLVVLGAGLALMIHLHPENLRAPAWVAYAAAGAFGIAGLTLVAQAFGRTRLYLACCAALMACLLAPPLWIAIANPERGRCRMNLLGYMLPAPEALCRAGFAIGATVGALMLLMVLRQAWHAWRQRGA